MWLWVWIGLMVVVVGGIAFWVDRRRGSSGASRGLDLPGTNPGRPKRIDTGDGFNGM